MTKSQLKVGGFYVVCNSQVDFIQTVVRVDEVEKVGGIIVSLADGKRLVVGTARYFGREVAGFDALAVERQQSERIAAEINKINYKNPDPWGMKNRPTPPAKPVDNSPHVIVKALAGTGKTTTMIGGVKKLKGIDPGITPSPQQAIIWDAICQSAGKVSKVAVVAFNKAIASELQTRVPQGVDALTMHSLGFRAVRNAFGSVNVNEYRVSDIYAELRDGRDPRELRKFEGEVMQAVETLVGLCKMNLCDGTEKELDRLAAHYSVELNGNRSKVFEMVPKVLERCKDVKKDNAIDFNDMIWVPVTLKLSVPSYDLLLVDESQDLNRCQQALARKAGKRLVLVGDENQAIYGFAGADSESMKRMEQELGLEDRGCVVLPLTCTRRCGKAIVAEAQKIVPDFEAFETNYDGQVHRRKFQDCTPAEDYRTAVVEGNMVLCRVNAPLVSECFKFIKQGRKANIQGRDVGRGLISLITKITKKYQGQATVADLAGALSDWSYVEQQKENAKRNPSEARLIAIQDKADCVNAFCDGKKTVQEVINAIEVVFTDDKNSPGIRLSSIHKAKGLEADRVFLIEPKGATVPHPMAKDGWQLGQEWNLRYVAITRAIKELVYVS